MQQATADEAAQGWLDSHPVSAELLRRNVVSTRFGVQQKNKIRPIDNFKSSCVNSACGVTEKVSMDTIDEIVNLCIFWLQNHRPTNDSERLGPHVGS